MNDQRTPWYLPVIPAAAALVVVVLSLTVARPSIVHLSARDVGPATVEASDPMRTGWVEQATKRQGYEGEAWPASLDISTDGLPSHPHGAGYATASRSGIDVAVGEVVQEIDDLPRAGAWIRHDDGRWRRTLDIPDSTLSSVVDVGHRFIALGAHIDRRWKSRQATWVSEDGESWKGATRPPIPSELGISSSGPIAFRERAWIVTNHYRTGETHLFSTGDGVDWGRSRFEDQPPLTRYWLTATDGRRLVALADADGARVESWSTIDGDDWRVCRTAFGNGSSGLSGLTAFGSDFMAISWEGVRSEPGLWRSSDGCRWQRIPLDGNLSHADTLEEIGVEGGALVVVGGIDTGQNSNSGKIYDIRRWVWRP